MINLGRAMADKLLFLLCSAHFASPSHLEICPTRQMPGVFFLLLGGLFFSASGQVDAQMCLFALGLSPSQPPRNLPNPTNAWCIFLTLFLGEVAILINLGREMADKLLFLLCSAHFASPSHLEICPTRQMPGVFFLLYFWARWLFLPRLGRAMPI